jgi:hypothetical protein
MKINKSGGWRVEITESGLTINVKLNLNLAICNDSSNHTINLNTLGNAVERQLRQSYEIRYFKTVDRGASVISGLDNFRGKRFIRLIKKNVYVHLKLNKRIVFNASNQRPDEHLLIIKDGATLKKATGHSVYGYANSIGGTIVYLNESKVKNIINGFDNNTIPHEFGHTLGLLHVDQNTNRNPFWGESEQYWSSKKQKSDSTNIMFSGGSRYMHDGSSMSVAAEQIELIIAKYNYEKINVPVK